MITFKQGIYSWILHCFVLFLTGNGYELKCSAPSQRPHRSNNFCNISGEEYMCLQDVINFQNIELCSKKRQFQRPGYRMVWSANFDGKTCATERYQPIMHFHPDESDCIFQKSICNEEGQITVNDGSPKNDRRCRCDYRRGYAFVSEPLNKCDCKPSNEDCSCYLKHCSYLDKLSPDYKCVWQYDLHRSFSCTTLLERGVDKDMHRIKEYIYHITDKRADKEMFSYSYFHADPHCILRIIYTSLFHIMLFGTTVIAYYVGGRRRPAKLRRKYSDKTVFNNGLAGKRTGEPPYMVNICGNGEKRLLNPEQSQKTTSKEKEKNNHVSMSADTNDLELFFRKEEVQNLRQLFISVIALSKNIGNTAPEHEIDKQFHDFLRKIHNCLVSKMKLPEC